MFSRLTIIAIFLLLCSACGKKGSTSRSSYEDAKYLEANPAFYPVQAISPVIKQNIKTNSQISLHPYALLDTKFPTATDRFTITGDGQVLYDYKDTDGKWTLAKDMDGITTDPVDVHLHFPNIVQHTLFPPGTNTIQFQPLRFPSKKLGVLFIDQNHTLFIAFQNNPPFFSADDIQNAVELDSNVFLVICKMEGTTLSIIYGKTDGKNSLFVKRKMTTENPISFTLPEPDTDIVDMNSTSNLMADSAAYLKSQGILIVSMKPGDSEIAAALHPEALTTAKKAKLNLLDINSVGADMSTSAQDMGNSFQVRSTADICKDISTAIILTPIILDSEMGIVAKMMTVGMASVIDPSGNSAAVANAEVKANQPATPTTSATRVASSHDITTRTFTDSLGDIDTITISAETYTTSSGQWVTDITSSLTITDSNHNLISYSDRSTIIPVTTPDLAATTSSDLREATPEEIAQVEDDCAAVEAAARSQGLGSLGHGSKENMMQGVQIPDICISVETFGGFFLYNNIVSPFLTQYQDYAWGPDSVRLSDGTVTTDGMNAAEWGKSAHTTLTLDGNWGGPVVKSPITGKPLEIRFGQVAFILVTLPAFALMLPIWGTKYLITKYGPGPGMKAAWSNTAKTIKEKGFNLRQGTTLRQVQANMAKDPNKSPDKFLDSLNLRPQDKLQLRGLIQARQMQLSKNLGISDNIDAQAVIDDNESIASEAKTQLDAQNAEIEAKNAELKALRAKDWPVPAKTPLPATIPASQATTEAKAALNLDAAVKATNPTDEVAAAIAEVEAVANDELELAKTGSAVPVEKSVNAKSAQPARKTVAFSAEIASVDPVKPPSSQAKLKSALKASSAATPPGAPDPVKAAIPDAVDAVPEEATQALVDDLAENLTVEEKAVLKEVLGGDHVSTPSAPAPAKPTATKQQLLDQANAEQDLLDAYKTVETAPTPAITDEQALITAQRTQAGGMVDGAKVAIEQTPLNDPANLPKRGTFLRAVATVEPIVLGGKPTLNKQLAAAQTSTPLGGADPKTQLKAQLKASPITDQDTLTRFNTALNTLPDPKPVPAPASTPPTSAETKGTISDDPSAPAKSITKEQLLAQAKAEQDLLDSYKKGITDQVTRDNPAAKPEELRAKIQTAMSDPVITAEQALITAQNKNAGLMTDGETIAVETTPLNTNGQPRRDFLKATLDQVPANPDIKAKLAAAQTSTPEGGADPKTQIKTELEKAPATAPTPAEAAANDAKLKALNELPEADIKAQLAAKNAEMKQLKAARDAQAKKLSDANAKKSLAEEWGNNEQIRDSVESRIQPQDPDRAAIGETEDNVGRNSEHNINSGIEGEKPGKFSQFMSSDAGMTGTAVGAGILMHWDQNGQGSMSANETGKAAADSLESIPVQTFSGVAGINDGISGPLCKGDWGTMIGNSWTIGRSMLTGMGSLADAAADLLCKGTKAWNQQVSTATTKAVSGFSCVIVDNVVHGVVYAGNKALDTIEYVADKTDLSAAGNFIGSGVIGQLFGLVDPSVPMVPKKPQQWSGPPQKLPAGEE